MNVRWISNKQMNSRVRTTNGNIQNNSNLKILHWNGGARRWENKRLEIENLIMEESPDLCYISESNLWEDIDPADIDIFGYKTLFPNTMTSLKHVRLLLLIKDYLNYEEIKINDNKEAAMVWIRVGDSKKKSVLVGGIYRQHQLLGQADRNLTSQTINL